MLERLYKAKSLKGLLKKLKYPIKLTKLSFVEVFDKKYPYVEGIKSKNFKIDFFLKKSRSNKKDNSIKVEKKNNSLKIFNPENLIYAFKYNPNYQSVDKNIPSLKFSLPSKEFLNAKKRKEIYLSNITDNNRIELNKDISEYSLPRINSENHAFKFSKYTPRKDLLNIINNDVLSYIEPYNPIKLKKVKGINFKNMRPHSIKHLINQNILNNPPPYYINYYAQMQKKPKSGNKIYKIWSSYNVAKEYISIDNEKLDKGVDKNLFNILMNKNNK